MEGPEISALLLRLMAPCRLTQEAKKCIVVIKILPLSKAEKFPRAIILRGRKTFSYPQTCCNNKDMSPKQESNKTYQLQLSNSGKKVILVKNLSVYNFFLADGKNSFSDLIHKTIWLGTLLTWYFCYIVISLVLRYLIFEIYGNWYESRRW